MKRRFLYYSLVAVMAASAVTFSSCDKDDDKDTNNTTTTTTTTDNTEKEEKKEVEKFSVTVNLNGKSILSQQVEVGKKISINLDELAAQEALKGYEILSITKDGKEVSGEVEVSADAKYEINAIKYAVLEYQLPNEEGKILHTKFDKKVSRSKKAKDAPTTTINHCEGWVYIKDNRLYFIFRINEDGDSHYFCEFENSNYESKTGKTYFYDLAKSKAYANPEPATKIYDEFFFKAGNNYYTASRLKKSDETVKGYQTDWIYEESSIKSKNAPIKESQEEIIIVTADKFNNTTYEYKDGIISLEDGEKYIYDGTYLYEINLEYSLTNYTKFNEDKLLDITKAPLPDGFPTDDYQIADENSKVYTRVGGDNYYFYGVYDWNGDNKISISGAVGAYDEFRNTLVARFDEDECPFGYFYTNRNECTVFPDGKIYIYDELQDIKANSIFTDGNYIVINVNEYTPKVKN